MAHAFGLPRPLAPRETKPLIEGICAHPAMAVAFGAIPMGLATIANGLLAFGAPWFGWRAVSLADALLWSDVALSLACGFVAMPAWLEADAV